LRHDMNEPALGTLERLAALSPKDGQAEADLAAAYAAHGELPKAEQAFHKALLLQPENVSAMVGLGNVYFKTERYDEAITILSQASERDGKAYEPLVLRARSYTHRKRYAEALGDLQRAQELGARDPEIEYYRAQAYRARGNEDEARRAMAAFKRARDQSNQSVEREREAGRLAVEGRRKADGGDLPGALALFEQAHTLDENNAAVLFRLAGLYFGTGQPAKAEESITQAVHLAPAEWDYHYLRGLIERAVGDQAAARDSLEAAVRLNPDAAEAHNQLGDLAMSRNDTQTAIREYTTALGLAPGEATYRTNLEAAKHSR